MKVWTRRAAVRVTREPTLTDQTLAPASGLDGDDCIVIIPCAVGCVVGRHPWTVAAPPVLDDRIAADPGERSRPQRADPGERSRPQRADPGERSRPQRADPGE